LLAAALFAAVSLITCVSPYSGGDAFEDGGGYAPAAPGTHYVKLSVNRSNARTILPDLAEGDNVVRSLYVTFKAGGSNPGKNVERVIQVTTTIDAALSDEKFQLEEGDYAEARIFAYGGTALPSNWTSSLTTPPAAPDYTLIPPVSTSTIKLIAVGVFNNGGSFNVPTYTGTGGNNTISVALEPLFDLKYGGETYTGVGGKGSLKIVKIDNALNKLDPNVGGFTGSYTITQIAAVTGPGGYGYEDQADFVTTGDGNDSPYSMTAGLTTGTFSYTGEVNNIPAGYYNVSFVITGNGQTVKFDEYMHIYGNMTSYFYNVSDAAFAYRDNKFYTVPRLAAANNPTDPANKKKVEIVYGDKEPNGGTTYTRRLGKMNSGTYIPYEYNISQLIPYSHFLDTLSSPPLYLTGANGVFSAFDPDWVFEGVYKNDARKVKWNFDSDKVAKDEKLYIKFVPGSNYSFNVTFIIPDGTDGAFTDVDEDLRTFDRDYMNPYELVTWDTTNDVTFIGRNSITIQAGDLAGIAKWEWFYDGDSLNNGWQTGTPITIFLPFLTWDEGYKPYPPSNHTTASPEWNDYLKALPGTHTLNLKAITTNGRPVNAIMEIIVQ